jgi:hypothetical protein
MAEIFAKISSVREKVFGALADVPDTLIGFILAMLILTVFGLGILIYMGYKMTN